jgi:hypothetical protein
MLQAGAPNLYDKIQIPKHQYNFCGQKYLIYRADKTLRVL